MPNFRVRPEQSSLSSQSSFEQPMHLHSPRSVQTRSPTTCFTSVEELRTLTKLMKPAVSAWSRLPRHIRDLILAHALLPDGPGTPIVVGLSDHYMHLKAVAVPVFLALGSWDAYTSAALVFYEHVHVDLYLFPTAAQTFLTSPSTLRPRCMVSRIQIRFTREKDIRTFDSGFYIYSSSGGLASMNIPTALRSMKAHGPLSEVELLLRLDLRTDSDDGMEMTEAGYFFSMARINLASWLTPELGSNVQQSDSSKSGASEYSYKRAEFVVAPAFLASRSFQSGVLPLLENGAFEISELKVQSVDENGKITVPLCLDEDAFVRYWLGATIVERLDYTPNPRIWDSPRSLISLCHGQYDDMVAGPDALPDDQEVAPSRQTRDEFVSSPIVYPSSTPCSDADSSSEVAGIDLSPSHHEPRPGDADTGEDSASPEEVIEDILLELHERFGVTPRETGHGNCGEQRDGIAYPETKSSSAPKASGSLELSPAVHLEKARTELIATLSSAVASANTMEAIARATADRQLVSYAAPQKAYEPEDTINHGSASGCVPKDSSSSSSAGDEHPRTPPTCRYPSLDEDSTPSASEEQDVLGREITSVDLSLIEGIFGARSEGVATLKAPEADTDCQETTPTRSAPKEPAGSKTPAKSKGKRTKRRRDGSPKAGHSATPEKARAAAPTNNRISKKRKYRHSTTDGQTGSSRAKRRKRARAYKDKQLKLARRIEAETAERERALAK